MSPLWAGVVAVVLLALNGTFVAAEFALLAARRTKLEQLAEDGTRGAGTALQASGRLSLMLAGAQLGITACSLGLGAVAEPALASVLAHWLHSAGAARGAAHAAAFVVALSVVVLAHLVVGELAPKSWAMADPERTAVRLGGAMWWFCVVWRPAIWAMDATANGILRLLGVEPQGELAAAHSSADLLMLLREDSAARELGVDATEMLSRSIRLGELEAGDAMTPRRDVVWVDADADVAEAARRMHDSGRSRLVVGDGELDEVRGTLHVKDVLAVEGGRRATTAVRELVRPVQVTHTHHRLEDLLTEMRQSRSHLVVVVDEHGSVAGVVTLEDVLEEVIGDFDDESDTATAWRHDDDGRTTVAGTVRPDELEQRFGVRLPHGPYETVAGYVIATLDRIPDVGDVVHVDGVTITVAARDGYAVTQVELRAQPAGGTAPAS